MIFWLAGSVGSLFSGFLQSAAYTNLNGTNGYAGCMYLDATSQDAKLILIRDYRALVIYH